MMSHIKRNPRLFINLTTALVATITAFGLQLSGEQVAALTSLCVAGTSFIVGESLQPKG